MAFGDGTDDAALRAAWTAFCDQLGAAGEQVFKDHNPGSSLHRADGFRFLTQNLGQAFDLALETKDPRHPVIHSFCTPLRKLGADAADLTYQQAWIDGGSEYRIFGTKGTARFFNIAVQGPRPDKRAGTDLPNLHEPFGDVPEANLLGQDIVADQDGSFEVFVGGPHREVNWLPTTPGSRKLFIRQGFDRWDEEPWILRIERIGMEGPRPMPTAGTMIEAMAWAGRFVTGLMEDWPDSQYLNGAVDPSRPNAFKRTAAGGADLVRGRAVDIVVWELDPHEALVVEFDDIDAFWMASLGGVFMNSFDFLYRPVSYTPSRAAVDSDGKVRLIMCAEDPGFHNWLDTQQFERGVLEFRTFLQSSGPVIATQLVELADLRSVLPPDSARTTPLERRAQMIERFHAIQRQRFGL